MVLGLTHWPFLGFSKVLEQILGAIEAWGSLGSTAPRSVVFRPRLQQEASRIVTIPPPKKIYSLALGLDCQPVPAAGSRSEPRSFGSRFAQTQRCSERIRANHDFAEDSRCQGACRGGDVSLGLKGCGGCSLYFLFGMSWECFGFGMSWGCFGMDQGIIVVL